MQLFKPETVVCMHVFMYCTQLKVLFAFDHLRSGLSLSAMVLTTTSKTGGGPPMQAVPKPIAVQPAFRPSRKPSMAPPRTGTLWHGGPRVQVDWLKLHNNAFDRISFNRRTDARPKVPPKNTERPMPGVPPPRSSVLKSLKLCAQWNARWDPKIFGAKDFKPEMNTGMICGRPVQVLVVSHAHAPPLEWDPYHVFAFWPLRPVVLCGPSAGSPEAPKMVHKFSVIQWWKVILICCGSLCLSPKSPCLVHLVRRPPLFRNWFCQFCGLHARIFLRGQKLTNIY